jgi:hypothetical protein
MFPSCPARHATSLLVLLLGLVFIPGHANATSGWHEYKVDIDGKYRILDSPSHSDVVRLDGQGNPIGPPILSVSLMVPPAPAYPGVGRLTGYATTSEHILTCHWGRKTRTDTYGTHAEWDTTTEFFFIIRKSDGTVEGPIAADSFGNHPVARTNELRWTTPMAAARSGTDDLAMNLLFFYGMYPVATLVIVTVLLVLGGLAISYARKAASGAIRVWRCDASPSDPSGCVSEAIARPPLRLYQFSLGSIFLLITTCALLLGTVLWTGFRGRAAIQVGLLVLGVLLIILGSSRWRLWIVLLGIVFFWIAGMGVLVRF